MGPGLRSTLNAERQQTDDRLTNKTVVEGTDSYVWQLNIFLTLL
jgi:hypothetical protein